MDRRDFLQLQQLAEAAGALLVPVADQELSPPAAEDAALLHFTRRAMATDFEVLLPFGMPDALSLAESALDEIDRLENQLTVYHEASEISRLNRQAAAGCVAVEERLFGLLQLSARLAEETGGAFDITSGALTKTWGFYRRQGRVPSAEELTEALQCVGMRHVVLGADRRSVRFLKPGLEINLGSIGKGYALDRAGECLRRQGVASALLHGGHSSILALGTMPGDGRGWPIGIRHPSQTERRLAVLRLRDRAIATSAATFQHLDYNGRKLGHILDPRSGWPAEGMASATAVAPTAAVADALATAFFILGVDATRAYCRDHRDVGAVLLPAGENAELVTTGLAANEIERLLAR